MTLAEFGVQPLPGHHRRKLPMNKTLLALLAAAAATLSIGAQAADADATLTHSQAADLKTQSNADYKASKKIADADHAVNTADCKTTLGGGTERACRKDAKAQAKLDKADAKMQNKAEKADIKNDTK
jgi:hypothetical protein